MTVELVTTASPELVEAMDRLLPQLSHSAAPLDASEVGRLLGQDSLHLFVFRPDAGPAPHAGVVLGEAPILGMLSLAVFEIPTGVRAWIEDVVVDADARGQGAGQQLVEAAITRARSLGARTVDLTSRPARESANRLYRRCGFVQRETNVYRYASAD